MTLPTQKNIELPILKVLANNNGQLPTSEAIEKVVPYFPDVTADDLASQLQSGGNRWRNCVRWAKQNLVRAGELDNSVRAVWKITDKGTARLRKEWASWKPRYRGPDLEGLVYVGTVGGPSERQMAESNPEEMLDAAVNAITKSTEREILDTISGIDPTIFESIIADLLAKMGYGDVHVTGRSGDGGIDGDCSLDALGLYRVHFQAKKWKNQVGAKEIRDFIGGIQTVRGDYGIFVTTSDFTADARETAKKSGKVRIVNGDELAGLMIKYDLGVSKTHLHLPRIDRDYFEEL